LYVIHTGTYTYTQLILSMPLAALQTDQYIIEYTTYIRKIILITILYRKTPNKIQKKKIDFYLMLNILTKFARKKNRSRQI